MQVNFLSSQTRINLMRSFAGESQARNRYTFAQQTALQKNLYAISEIFKFTADEEKAHAEIFFDLLKETAVIRQMFMMIFKNFFPVLFIMSLRSMK